MKVKVISGQCKYRGELFNEGKEADISAPLKKCMESAGVVFESKKDLKLKKAGKKK